MTFLQEKLLPLDLSSKVDVQITILKSGEVYMALVSTDRAKTRIPINLKPGDVNDLNGMLQTAIQKVADSYTREEIAYEGALANLIENGAYAFTQIFKKESSRETIRDALRVCNSIQITSEDFFIPWELLYDDPTDENARISNFWGMRYIISRWFIQDPGEGASKSKTLESTRPRIGLVVYKKLWHVANSEIRKFNDLHKAKQIQLKPLTELSKQRRDTGLKELKRFLTQELHVIHFACHACEASPVAQSYLLISEDFELSIKDCSIGEFKSFKMLHSPFIFLNACRTGLVNPLYTSSWAGKFLDIGARGVLGTDFSVPDWFGAAFSDVLYQLLLSGQPIGEALIEARRLFWIEQNQLNLRPNPLGLAYALYSPPSIKFVVRKRR